jgi:anthranilate/para-aminobenzoate synthase component I
MIARPAKVLQLPAGSTFAQWRAFADACGLSQRIRGELPAGSPAIVPGWVYQLSFELGEVLEPALAKTPQHPARLRSASSFPNWPLATAFRVKEELALPRGQSPEAQLCPSPREVVTLHRPSAASREGYEEAVRACLAYIRAGDCYQVNLAHALRGVLGGSLGGSQEHSPRVLSAALWQHARPWFGAHLELPDGSSIASASPELFLRFDPATARLSTRPMKGTRRAHAGHDRELRESAKDRAELAMIVDLMRNDLGRICELGSMRVDASHTIERHGAHDAALLQATATVSGTPSSETTWADAIEACFPPGSVTGAPKVRAVQVIRELEPALRGPYCGCIGFVSDSGASAWSVAIRTACVRGRELCWHVGAGIVAESQPRAEWEETLAKASALGA